MILYRHVLLSTLCCATWLAQAQQKKPLHKVVPAHKPHPAALLWIEGWTTPPTESWNTPPEWFSEDPLLGRMSCPPLSRVLLKDKKSDPLLLRSVTSEDGGKLWRFTLRSGLYWWDGKGVTHADLVHFMHENLAAAVKAKSGGLWQLPPYTITSHPEGIEVRFSQAQPVGPYLFNGIPLWKPVATPSTSELPFQCVGTYKLRKGDPAGDFTLHAVAQYGVRTHELRVTNHLPPAQKAYLSFQTADKLPVQSTLLA